METINAGIVVGDGICRIYKNTLGAWQMIWYECPTVAGFRSASGKSKEALITKARKANFTSYFNEYSSDLIQL